MTIRPSFAALIALALGAAGVAVDAVPSRAVDGEREMAFPENFAAGVLYVALDRADLEQYRELYAPVRAIAAVKAGKPLPLGTVLTMVMYSAKRDSDGKPIIDANGRFVKDRLVGYLVMEKHSDRDARRFPAEGDSPWRFQIFRADKAIEKSANLSDCVACHRQRRDHDFVFTGEKMQPASAQGRAR